MPSLETNWNEVFQALKDPNWDFRTIDGIARSTQLSPQDVKNLLDSHKEDVRCTTTWDRPDRVLYTLRSRKRTWRDWAAAFQEYARIPYSTSRLSR